MERFQKTGIKHRIILVAKKKDIPSDMEIKLIKLNFLKINKVNQCYKNAKENKKKDV